ncbi:hypothetical protein [Sphingobium sp. MK2]|uniref:hypothetical protein n=1 Tax=Sphingobium sp. MK2 TaxID=3116540 RepID=UPI0032E3631E
MYQVTSIDLCAAGYERLRSHSEIILLAYPTLDETPWDVRDQWLDDMRQSDHGDAFDWNAAEEAVRSYCADNWQQINATIAMDAPESWTDDMEGAYYLYLETEA